MKNTIAFALTVIFLMSCSNECTKLKEGREEQDGYVLAQENTYPDCHDTANYFNKAFYANGTLAHSVEIHNNERDGYFESFDIDGNPQRAGAYQNGKRYGLWKIWNDNAYMEKRYVNDTLQGETFEILEDGHMVIGQYENDLEQGLWAWLTADSVLVQTSTYKYGKLDGERTGFYAIGGISSLDVYREDTLFERVAFYDISGKQTLWNGNGTCIEYGDDGEVLSVTTYENGRKVKE